MPEGQSDERTRKNPTRDTEETGGIAADGLQALRQRYEDIQEIGRGGMGVVYRARDRETGDLLALKQLAPGIAEDAELVERFKRELILARKVTHPNVCRVHEFLPLGDTAVISMEYVEGETLGHFLKRYGPVSVRKGIQWARQICAGLAVAHRQGVVHRDLKPENIMVCADGTTKVMDFGIARSMATGKTQTGAIIGTPAYMSPEQAQGKPADARSDVYALGLILYEMFTGRPPFQADTPIALLGKQVNDPPPPPSTVEPYLPGFLSTAIVRCLEKKPEARFQTVEELEASLSPRGARPLEASQLPRANTRRVVWLAAAGVLLALICVAGVLLLRPKQPMGMRHAAEVTSVSFSPNGQQLASASADKTIKLWDTATEKLLRNLVGHTRAVNGVAFSPDGRLLASGSVDRTIKLWKVDGSGGAEHTLTGHTRPVNSVAFSPDGRWIASGSDDETVRLWDAVGGHELHILKGHTGTVAAVAFSPDSTLVASGSNDDAVRLWNPITGELVRLLTGHEDAVDAVAFSPDGRWLASGSYDKNVKLWEVATGHVLRTFLVSEGWVDAVAFSPDGTLLATGSQDGIVRSWEVATGKERQRFPGHADAVTSVAFSPDGKWLASGSWDGSVRRWGVEQHSP